MLGLVHGKNTVPLNRSKTRSEELNYHKKKKKIVEQRCIDEPNLDTVQRRDGSEGTISSTRNEIHHRSIKFVQFVRQRAIRLHGEISASYVLFFYFFYIIIYSRISSTKFAFFSFFFFIYVYCDALLLKDETLSGSHTLTGSKLFFSKFGVKRVEVIGGIF